jgi:hypothetical protein
MVIGWPNTGLWVLRSIAALVLLQTLYFKFSAFEEAVYIFSTVGMEPWGRIASGILELIASVLLIVYRKDLDYIDNRTVSRKKFDSS